MYKDIPDGSVVGINYSGMHDSAVVIVAPNGEPISALALERISRVKQDGRPPYTLLEDMPWERILKVGISTDRQFVLPKVTTSELLETRLITPHIDGLYHGQPFYDFFDQIPCEKEFVCHQLAHASSAYWGSSFDDALCLTYDGGMSNSPWFGGLYKASNDAGLQPLDRFSALHYAKVSSLYTFVTALLGFAPNKHEGKITGLAAYGEPTDACRNLLKTWFEAEFSEIESVMEWVYTYDKSHVPMFLVNDAKIQPFRDRAAVFSREEMAATVQEFAEQHIVDLLTKARMLGWSSDNICLAGGLFANVKINQCVVETGFKNLFVAPPMTDDGTALGAAWHILSRQPGFRRQQLHSVSLGPSYSNEAIHDLLTAEGIKFVRPESPVNKVAELLADGAVVAVFQGGMEFGPRALGNRSILAQATEHDINQSLNTRLNRTEFMPFAPMSRIEDAEECYLDIDKVRHAAEFMTVTVNCTEHMKATCPAVVHIDGTARPQLVSKESNSFIHGVLSQYKKMTGKPALVNTSFNIHEEPIVCSPENALQGFFEAGLDYLYFGSGHVVSFKENKEYALKHLQAKMREPNRQNKTLTDLVQLQSARLLNMSNQLSEKENVIQKFNLHLAEKLARSEALIARQARTIEQQIKILHIYNFLLSMPFVRPIGRFIRRGVEICMPRLGNLNQYTARPLSFAPLKTLALSNYPKISIVTPSFGQGHFIEKTLLSIFNQEYPNLEYFVQDGGSTDGTVDILKKYENKLSGWVSERDGGQSQAINRGFSRTTGEIMAWVNSDDLLSPNTLTVVADFFNRHPDVDVVYGNRLLIDENDDEIGRWIMPAHDDKVLSWVDFVPQETMFWRRRIWEKTGSGIDESFRFAMDWDLLARFRGAGAKFEHIAQFLGAFRIHEDQKTSATINEVGHQEMDRIRERLLGRVPNCGEVRKAIIPFLLKHIFVDAVYRVKVRLSKRG